VKWRWKQEQQGGV